MYIGEKIVKLLQDLGVRRVVNGQFPITRLGGSVIPKEVLDAMEESTNNWCGMWELEDKVGRAIARYCSADALTLLPLFRRASPLCRRLYCREGS